MEPLAYKDPLAPWDQRVIRDPLVMMDQWVSEALLAAVVHRDPQVHVV